MDNSNDTRTKSNPDDSNAQALYSIDKNGEIKITLFYFEVVEGDGETSVNEVLTEISNTLQIVPSLVTDLGKYILFSGCKYQINNSGVSDKALLICETYIRNNYKENMVYMIRKADGALFDLTDRFFFCYTTYDEYSPRYFSPYYEGGFYIPSVTYLTSQQNNLFVLGGEPYAVFRVEDNGDAVDFRQMTQYLDGGWLFFIDATENIYTAETHNDIGELHIYGANGGFNLHKFNSYTWIFDTITDEAGVPFIFIAAGYSEFMSARLNNCTVEFMSKQDFNGQEFKFKESLYVGGNGNLYHWCDYSSILSYNMNTHQWSLRNLSNDILQILSTSYDAIIYGSKTYCATVKGSSIEVTEVDFASETYLTYNLNIDMSSIIPTRYEGRMIQDIPYLTIKGRSPVNGTEVTFTIDLISGTNNSTFAQDGRNVISFFRINDLHPIK